MGGGLERLIEGVNLIKVYYIHVQKDRNEIPL
jgi:hypothetical protein